MTPKQLQKDMKKRRWTVYRLWQESGVHTSSLYRFLAGTQKSLSADNEWKIRKALKGD